MSIFLIGSCEKNTPVAPILPEPELVGCEAAEVYDWDSVEFSATLDQGEDTWLAFSLEEINIFSIYLVVFCLTVAFFRFAFASFLLFAILSSLSFAFAFAFSCFTPTII